MTYRFTYTDTCLVGLTQCKHIIMIEPIDLFTFTDTYPTQ